MAPTTTTGGAILRVLAAFALVGFVTCFIAAQHPLGGDGKNYGLVARSLLADGDIRLDEFSAQLSGNTRTEQGHVFNYFPLGPSLLIVPFFAVTKLFVSNPAAAETLAARCAAAACYGSALALFFLVAVRMQGMTLWRAALLTLVFGFCSGQFFTHLGGLSSHGSAVPFVIAALLALTGNRDRSALGAGLLLVIAWVMRPTAGALVPICGLWLWLERRRACWHFLAAVVAAGCAVLLLNTRLYGHVLPPYSAITRLVPSGLGVGLAGNLFSPSRGLLIYCPWVLVAAVGGVRTFRDKEGGPFFKLLAVAFAVHLVVVSCFPHWWGGWSYGPRFLAEMMPELCLLTIPAIPWVLGAPPLRWRARSMLFAASVAYSLLVAILGVTRGAGDWNHVPDNVDQHPARVWDWSDPQILRALRLALRPDSAAPPHLER